MREHSDNNPFAEHEKENTKQSINLQNQYLARSTMTMSGTLNKALLGLMVSFLGAFLVRDIPLSSYPNVVPLACLFAFITGLVCAFKPHLVRYFIFPYSFCQGVALGLLSFLLDEYFPGIVSEALFSTFAILLVVFLGQRSGLLRTTPKSRKIVIYILFAFCLLQSFCVLFHALFGYTGALYRVLFGTNGKETEGLISIFLSLFLIALSCFMLVMKLEMITAGIHDYKLPKSAEWYCAFLLLVTVFRVYFEILKLIEKLRNRGQESEGEFLQE